MSFFLTIFYSSLAVIALLLVLKKIPEELADKKNMEEWYLVNFHAIDTIVRRLFSVHVQPKMVKVSLFTLKITQNRLQSIRRQIRNLIKRLSEIEDKHVAKRHHRSV